MLNIKARQPDIYTRFKTVVLSGQLKDCRERLIKIADDDFFQSGGDHLCLTDHLSAVLKVAASQRLRPVLFNSRNVNSFTLRQTGNWAPYYLSYMAARAFGCNRTDSLIAHILFLFDIIPRSLVRVYRACVRVICADFVESVGEAGSVYFIGASENVVNTDEQLGLNSETWLRANYLEPDCTIFHSVGPLNSILSQPKICTHSFLLNIPRWRKLIIIAKGCFFLSRAFFGLVLGDWRRLFMVDDLIYCEAISQTPASKLHRKYIFLFQGDQYRPMWTWVAEKKGAACVQLNYAANMVPSLDGKYHDRDGLRTALWTEIIPFNQKIADLIEPIIIKRSKYTPKLIRAPSVYFSDKATSKIDVRPEKCMCIFDIPPIALADYLGCMDMNDYALVDGDDPISTNRKFVLDCLKVAESLNWTLVTKMKRADPRLHPEYTQLMDDLVQSGRLICINPQVSPLRVIQSSVAVVALPFTSVGYFCGIKKNICFYDPFSKLSAGHESAQGVPLITGFSSLLQWAEKRNVNSS